MEDKPPRPNLKRSFPEDDDDSDKPPTQKRVRFPKGRKIKPGDEKVDAWTPSELDLKETKARRAARERAIRRSKLTAELLCEDDDEDISAAEVHNEEGDEGETSDNDGIEKEPFNLDKEKEEGYFDEQGNYVEYIHEKEVKDAWLDSVEVDHKLAKKGLPVMNAEDDIDDLSSKEIGKIKRRIADALEPGETILQALRRLKGTSNNKKEKMSAGTQLIFDQLTEDAIKLINNGDYNVYEEKQEVFEREAEGYERLARARGEGTSMDSDQRNSDSAVAIDFVANGTDVGETFSDMFAEDDENAVANATSDGSNLFSGANDDISGQPSESGGLQSDYVYDESSGYYYSSSLGYYYDPSSGLYCYAASGQWYSYNEATGSYDEIKEAALEAS